MISPSLPEPITQFRDRVEAGRLLAEKLTVYADRPDVVALRRLQAACIVIAAPVAAPETCEALSPEVDEIVCVITPDPLYAIGLWYADFSQTSDEEVRDLLGAF